MSEFLLFQAAAYDVAAPIVWSALVLFTACGISGAIMVALVYAMRWYVPF